MFNLLMSNLFNFLDLRFMADNFLIPYLQKVLTASNYCDLSSTNQVKLLSERFSSETCPKTGTSLMRHSSSSWQSLRSRESTRPISPSAKIFRVTSWIPEIHFCKIYIFLYKRKPFWVKLEPVIFTVFTDHSWKSRNDVCDRKIYFYMILWTTSEST